MWPVRVALAAAFLASTACGSGDDNNAPVDSGTPDSGTPVDSGTDSTVATDAAKETSTATPDTGTDSTVTTTPDTGAPDTSTAPDTGSPDTGTPASDGGGDGGPLSFSKDVYPIIQTHCAGCHGVGNIPPPADAGPDAANTNGNGFTFGRLDMGDASVAWADLVGDGGVLAQGLVPVPADGGVTCASLGADAGLLRVAGDDAGGSLLANKVAAKEDGGPVVFCGNPMPNPPAAPALAETDVQTIMTWINQGAKP
ncbi:MAG TPA: hypothetical protein VGM06_08445 [Polyangiaceae bacterium]|jgi:hypothetical protein